MNCRACRSDRLDEVLSMDPMPLAGAFAATAEEARAMPKYPLTWLLCHDCGLVNVAPDIPDELIYSTYSYAASTVPALVRHHTRFASVLIDRYRESIRLLEIGGNDGVLLNQLPRDWELTNCDPSDVASRAFFSVASVDSPAAYGLIDEPFQTGQWHLNDGDFDVVTSSNAFAHFTDIAGALDGVARVLRPGGEFWIEVHDLDRTLWSKQWDTIYHEHKVEWDLRSLRLNLARRGFSEVSHGYLELHGGLIRACFRKDGRGVETLPTRSGDTFAYFQRCYDERKAPNLPPGSWAYGAAARATVYLNQADTGVEAVVDGSALRAGKFVPGLGIPVVTPPLFDEMPPPATLITAWNHADDIKAKHPKYTNWVTAW